MEMLNLPPKPDILSSCLTKLNLKIKRTKNKICFVCITLGEKSNNYFHRALNVIVFILAQCY